MCSSTLPCFRRRVGGSFEEWLERAALRQGHMNRGDVFLAEYIWMPLRPIDCISVCINDDGCLLLSKITWMR